MFGWSITHNWCGPHLFEATYGASRYKNPIIIMPTIAPNIVSHSPLSAGMITMNSAVARLEVMFIIFFASLFGSFIVLSWNISP